MIKLKLCLLMLLPLLLGCSLSKTDFPLKVKTDPINAQLKITQLKETEDYLPIKVFVKDFGLWEPKGKKKLPSQQVNVRISKKGYLTRSFQIFKPKKSVLAKLVKFSPRNAQIAESLSRAGRVFRLPIAYPNYIPKGFKISRVESLDFTHSAITYPGIVIDWSREKQQIGLIVYNTETVKTMIGKSVGFFKPKVVRKIRIDSRITAVIEDYSNAYFLVNGQPISTIFTFSNVKNEEVIKITKSIKIEH